MNNLNVIELRDTVKPSSSERANKYTLDEINKIKDYFNNEIKERKDIIKKLNKYLVSFGYLDKLYRCFFDFSIYNRDRYKYFIAKSY